MRVSDSQRFRIVESRVEKAKASNARVIDELATQKAIREVSDNPIGMTKALRLRDRVSSIGQYVKNIDYAKGFLAKSESAISDIVENLMRAKELGLYMANDTNDAMARQSTGREVEELVKEVVQLGNAQYNGRFVFGGFRTQSPPLSSEGNYLGDDGSIFVEVAEGGLKQINVTARNLFETTPSEREAGHFNMLHSLEVLLDGMQNDDKYQIQKALDELDFQIEKATTFNASLGGLTNALDQTQKRVEKEKDDNTAFLSSIEDSDIYKASSDFRKTDTVLQSTLLASNKMLQPSLLNYLK